MSPARVIRQASLVMTTFHGSEGRAGTVRLGYLIANAFELIIAVVTTIANVVYIFNRHAYETTSIGRATRPYDLFWVALFIVGGCLITVGLTRPSTRMEVIGLILFASALVVNAIAITTVAGVPGVSAIATYAGLVLAATIRVRAILWALQRR